MAPSNFQEHILQPNVIENQPEPSKDTFGRIERNQFGCFSSIIDHIKDSPLKKRIRGRHNIHSDD